MNRVGGMKEADGWLRFHTELIAKHCVRQPDFPVIEAQSIGTQLSDNKSGLPQICW